MKKPISAVGTALALAVTLAACETNSEDADSAQTLQPTATATGEAAPDAAESPAHTDADSDFAQMMIVHHEGAIEMADVAAKQAATKEVRSLAHQISVAQDPEIEKMTAWLAAWGEEAVPTGDDATGRDHSGRDHSGMDHGGMLMEGLSQQEAMSDLEARSGTDFDKRFLELMTAHHQGAVRMAKVELDRGQNLYALGLAQQIIVD